MSKWLLLGTVGGLALAPCAALAQNEESNEIIVTAQKREQNIQDVPIAMQAVTGEQLTELGITTAFDISRIAPNIAVSTQGAANRQISIRGVGTNDFFGNATGSVGVYMDEVTMSAPFLTNLGLFDMERVEVLRGPQNSLFGRNTTGGAVNYISRRPEVGHAPEGFIRGNYGNYNRIDLEAGVSVPLGDQAALRLAGMRQQSDGLWNNLADGGADYGDKDRYSLRATLVVEPTPETDITVNLHFGREDSQIDPFRFAGVRDASGSIFAPGLPPQEVNFGAVNGGANSNGQVVDANDWSDIYRVGNDRQFVESYGFYIKLVQDLNWATFTSITSFDTTDVQYTYDLGGPGPAPSDITMLNGNDQSFDQWSQELRLQSTGDGRLRWIAGLYYFEENSTLGQNMGFGPFDAATGSGGAAALLLLAGNPYSNQASFSIAELENTVISPYGQVEYDLTDDVAVTLGLRHTSDEKRAPSIFVGNVDTAALGRDQFRSNQVMRSLASGLPSCDFDGDGNQTGGTTDNRGVPCAQTLTPDDLNFEQWGGRLAVDYRPTDNLLLYASYSRGFRSGKHDIEFFHGPQTGFARQDQDVETLDAYEIGLKSDWLDRRLVFNAAAFFYSWNDQQFFDVDPMTGPVFVNVPKSELQGVEVELRWTPTADFAAQLSGGLLQSEVIDEGDDVFGLIEEGHELPFAPESSANLLLSYDFHVGGSRLTLQGDLQYQGESKGFLRDVAYVDAIESSTTVNARATWFLGVDERLELSLYGQNLTEEERCYYERDLFAFSGSAYCLPNAGVALYGVEARYSF